MAAKTGLYFMSLEYRFARTNKPGRVPLLIGAETKDNDARIWANNILDEIGVLTNPIRFEDIQLVVGRKHEFTEAWLVFGVGSLISHGFLILSD